MYLPDYLKKTMFLFFFFLCRPTDLDALVYGYLFTIITTQLPMTNLSDIVDEFPNIKDFVQRVDLKYFDGQLNGR